MENQPNLTPQQSLDLIHTMISRSRNRVCADGYYLILWGTLIGLAQLLTYLKITFSLGFDTQLLWYVTIGLGMAGSIGYGILVERKRGQGSHLDLVYGIVWITFFITWGLMIAFHKVLTYESAIIFMACGHAVLLTGVIIRFRPLIIGSLFLYAACITSLILAPGLPKEILLVYTASLIAGYIVPGLMLNNKIKREKRMAINK